MRAYRSVEFVALCGLLLCACSGGDDKPSTSGAGGGGAASGPGGSTPQTPAGPSVLQYHRNASRDGLYVDAAFTRAAAASIHHDKSFNAQVSGPTYAQPLYFHAGSGGTDLVIVATEQNQVSAFSAADGSVVWQKSLGTPASNGNLPCGNIRPLGITGTPVIDASSKTLYLDAMTLEGDTPKHMIHALSLGDGKEVSGWPVDVNASVKAGSRAFDSRVQNQRGALLILKGMLYVPYGGHWGDCGNYHGWVVGVPLDKPSAPIAWATRARAGGIWAPGGIASDGSSLFVATGNTMADDGSFNAPNTYGDGESVIRLPTDLKYSMKDADFAAAMNWQMLDQRDADVGGSSPVLFNLPGATPSALAIALGKDGAAYLLDAKNLGGTGHWLASKRVSSDQIIQAAVAFTTTRGTFVVFRASGMGCASGSQVRQLTALHIAAGSPPTISVAWCGGGDGSGSPIVTTTDGSAESIIWYVSAEADNRLLGFNAETGAQIFGGGGDDDALGSVDRFQTPIAAKGRIFVAASNQLFAFSLK